MGHAFDMAIGKLRAWLGDMSLRKARDTLQPSRREAIREITASTNAATAKLALDWMDDPAKLHADLAPDVIGGFTPAIKPHRSVDRIFDGYLIGEGGALFPPTTPLSELPPIKPNNGKSADRTIYAINGIMTDVDLHRTDLQSLANTGANVVGIHNATAGLVKDLGQCVGDKLDVASNPPVDTVADKIYQALHNQEPLTFVAHSQGALVLVRALQQVVRRMTMEDGHSEAEVQRRLGALSVETFGGATTRYVDGPRYQHFINKFDVVPMLAGVGMKHNPFAQAGEGAVLTLFSEVKSPTNMPKVADGWAHYFARAVDRSVHGPQDIYFQRRGTT
jgi:hypothetical protein